MLRVAEARVPELREKVLALSKMQRHRGPDWSGIHLAKTAVLAHERLGIMDPESGHQPLVSTDSNIILTVNGEIYNHRTLRDELSTDYEFQVRVCLLVSLCSVVCAWRVCDACALRSCVCFVCASVSCFCIALAVALRFCSFVFRREAIARSSSRCT